MREREREIRSERERCRTRQSASSCERKCAACVRGPRAFFAVADIDEVDDDDAEVLLAFGGDDDDDDGIDSAYDDCDLASVATDSDGSGLRTEPRIALLLLFVVAVFVDVVVVGDGATAGIAVLERLRTPLGA